MFEKKKVKTMVIIRKLLNALKFDTDTFKAM